MDKLDYVGELCNNVRVLEQRTPPQYSTLKETASWLGAVNGLGTFLAAQVVADMKNTPNHPLQQAEDWWSWSAPGPGSLKGLRWYFGHDKITPKHYQSYLSVCMKEVLPHVNPEVPRISAQDFQNCLCEFSKWCRVKYEDGHIRNLYASHLRK